MAELQSVFSHVVVFTQQNLSGIVEDDQLLLDISAQRIGKIVIPAL